MLDGGLQGSGDGAAHGGEDGWGVARQHLSELWSGLRDGGKSHSRILLQDGTDSGRWLTQEMDEGGEIGCIPTNSLRLRRSTLKMESFTPNP